ncbi:MAG TPA: hypothetical protein VEZ11_18635 [Thermoanaerobaculia bacterium]|nr:hypothetical protein [Thermoanaerobaculia bacterium]
MSSTYLTRIWLTPPLAFGRLGASPTPCAAFHWAANDLTPDGSGMTTLVPAETLDLDENGVVSRSLPDRIVFRDNHGIRPVCPYFELHGTWHEDGREKSGPITTTLLDKLKLTTKDIQWQVHVANLKSFDYTFEEGDRIEAVLNLRGDDTARHTLEGRSPRKARRPLVPKGAFIPYGSVQIAKPGGEFREIRLRFYAPAGLTYGPSDYEKRMAKANVKLPGNREWRRLKLPPERLILNPRSAWATWVLEQATLGPFPKGTDFRHTPWTMFATLLVGKDANSAENHALGLVDDMSDGLIRCTIKSRNRELTAWARIVVGPPDYAPAHRIPVSLADNLADREDREGPRKANWTMDELRELVLDIFERAFETSSLMNKDYQNYRSRDDNVGRLEDMAMTSPFDREDIDAMLWPDITTDVDSVRRGKADAEDLSAAGVRKHRRYAAISYLEDRFRENPELFHQWIRRPLDPNPFFDTRMPALMRGSDTRPWHLTRRQWEIVRQWADKLQETAEPGSHLRVTAKQAP